MRPMSADHQLSWSSLIGISSNFPMESRHRVLRRDSSKAYDGELLYVESLPGQWQKCYLALPRNRSRHPLPCVVVYWYDIDSPLGINLGSREWSTTPDSERSGLNVAERLLRQGFAVLVQRWFLETHVTNFAPEASLSDKYGRAAVYELSQYPGYTGLGRMVTDGNAVLSFLQRHSQVDAARLGCFGHSMGGKWALYQTALDERVSAAAVSEPGLLRRSSNWDAEWYLGEHVSLALGQRDHDELLANVAPRPFLVIAGDTYDGADTESVVNDVALQMRSQHPQWKVDFHNHHSGHIPTEGSLDLMCEWFIENL